MKDTQIVYKVVCRIEGRLYSCFFGKLGVIYRPGRFVSAPKALLALGYGLLAFRWVSQAKSFMFTNIDGLASEEVLLFAAEASGMMDADSHGFIGNYPRDELVRHIKRYHQTDNWPAGTLMAARIKLVRQLEA